MFIYSFFQLFIEFYSYKYVFIKLLLCRVPAGEIFKLSLSPYFDDIAVFHVRAVSFKFFIIKSLTFFSIILKGWSHGRLKACSWYSINELSISCFNTVMLLRAYSFPTTFSWQLKNQLKRPFIFRLLFPLRKVRL